MFQDDPMKKCAQFGTKIWKVAILGKSLLKFTHAVELHLGANLLPARTLARINIFDEVKISWS